MPNKDIPTPEDELSLYCRVIFKNGEPLFIEKLDPLIPEVIDLEAYTTNKIIDELKKVVTFLELEITQSDLYKITVIKDRIKALEEGK